MQLAMRELVSTIGPNKPAKKAWERAATDHLVERVSTVNPAAVSDGALAVDFSKLTTAFNRYGILKGGGVLRTVRIALPLGADDPRAIERLLTRAMLDPALAAHLLTRKTAEAGSPAWDKELAKLLPRGVSHALIDRRQIAATKARCEFDGVFET